MVMDLKGLNSNCLFLLLQAHMQLVLVHAGPLCLMTVAGQPLTGPLLVLAKAASCLLMVQLLAAHADEAFLL